MNFNLYKPAVFQGNLKMKNYFEGWYFKHVSDDLRNVYSFIPGISLNESDPHAFIQVINGVTGESNYIDYPLPEFHYRKDRFYIKIGESEFSDQNINLHIRTGNLHISGQIDYHNSVKYPVTLLSPGIMGWYAFVPYMECKHGIVSVNHDLSGCIKVNDRNVDFTGGKGYIEKDWGTSFPEAWLWIQANNFKDKDTSFYFSVAKIPWRGRFFMGFIAFLYAGHKFHLFSTYNKSRIKEIRRSDEYIHLVLENKNSVLKIKSVRSTSGELRAPVNGKMMIMIRESLDSAVDLELYDSGKRKVYADSSPRAGMEVIEKLFEYF